MEFLVSIHITLFSMSSTIKGYIAFVRVAQEKGARDGKLRNASANVSVRVLKIVAAIIDALLILLTALEVLVVFLLIAIVTVVIGGGVLLVSGLLGGDFGGNGSVSGSDTSVSAPATPGAVQPEAGKGSFDKPDGLKQEEWDKLSDQRKQVVSRAVQAVNTPVTSDYKNMNKGRLFYDWTERGQGVVDCSTFVSEVGESLGYLNSGGKRQGDPFDFSSMNKGDLQDYMYTGAMLQAWGGASTQVSSTQDVQSKAKPGDIIVNSTHVAIYVGENDAGKPVIVHAFDADPNPGKAFEDVALAKPVAMAGMSDLSVMWPGAFANSPAVVVDVEKVWHE